MDKATYFAPNNRGEATILGRSIMPGVVERQQARKVQEEVEKAKLDEARKKRMQEFNKSIGEMEFDPISTPADQYINNLQRQHNSDITNLMTQKGDVDEQIIRSDQLGRGEIKMQHNMVKSFDQTYKNLIDQITEDRESDLPLYNEEAERMAYDIYTSAFELDPATGQVTGVKDVLAAEKKLKQLAEDPAAYDRLALAKKIGGEVKSWIETTLTKDKGYLVRTETEQNAIAALTTYESVKINGRMMSVPQVNINNPFFKDLQRDVLNSNPVAGKIVANIMEETGLDADRAFAHFISNGTQFKREASAQQDQMAIEFQKRAWDKGDELDVTTVENRMRGINNFQNAFGQDGKRTVPTEEALQFASQLEQGGKVIGKPIARVQFIKTDDGIPKALIYTGTKDDRGNLVASEEPTTELDLRDPSLPQKLFPMLQHGDDKLLYKNKPMVTEKFMGIWSENYRDVTPENAGQTDVEYLQQEQVNKLTGVFTDTIEDLGNYNKEQLNDKLVGRSHPQFGEVLSVNPDTEGPFKDDPVIRVTFRNEKGGQYTKDFEKASNKDKLELAKILLPRENYTPAQYLGAIRNITGGAKDKSGALVEDL